MEFIVPMQLLGCIISPICGIDPTGIGVKSFATGVMQIEFEENCEFAGFRLLNVHESFAQTMTSEAGRFYERPGYKLIGEFDGDLAGYCRYFLKEQQVPKA